MPKASTQARSSIPAPTDTVGGSNRDKDADVRRVKSRIRLSFPSSGSSSDEGTILPAKDATTCEKRGVVGLLGRLRKDMSVDRKKADVKMKVKEGKKEKNTFISDFIAISTPRPLVPTSTASSRTKNRARAALAPVKNEPNVLVSSGESQEEKRASGMEGDSLVDRRENSQGRGKSAPITYPCVDFPTSSADISIPVSSLVRKRTESAFSIDSNATLGAWDRRGRKRLKNGVITDVAEEPNQDGNHPGSANDPSDNVKASLMATTATKKRDRTDSTTTITAPTLRRRPRMVSIVASRPAPAVSPVPAISDHLPSIRDSFEFPPIPQPLIEYFLARISLPSTLRYNIKFCLPQRSLVPYELIPRHLLPPSVVYAEEMTREKSDIDWGNGMQGSGNSTDVESSAESSDDEASPFGRFLGSGSVKEIDFSLGFYKKKPIFQFWDEQVNGRKFIHIPVRLQLTLKDQSIDISTLPARPQMRCVDIKCQSFNFYLINSSSSPSLSGARPSSMTEYQTSYIGDRHVLGHPDKPFHLSKYDIRRSLSSTNTSNAFTLTNPAVAAYGSVSSYPGPFSCLSGSSIDYPFCEGEGEKNGILLRPRWVKMWLSSSEQNPGKEEDASSGDEESWEERKRERTKRKRKEKKRRTDQRKGWYVKFYIPIPIPVLPSLLASAPPRLGHGRQCLRYPSRQADVTDGEDRLVTPPYIVQSKVYTVDAKAWLGGERDILQQDKDSFVSIHQAGGIVQARAEFSAEFLSMRGV